MIDDDGNLKKTENYEKHNVNKKTKNYEKHNVNKKKIKHYRSYELSDLIFYIVLDNKNDYTDRIYQRHSSLTNNIEESNIIVTNDKSFKYKDKFIIDESLLRNLLCIDDDNIDTDDIQIHDVGKNGELLTVKQIDEKNINKNESSYSHQKNTIKKNKKKLIISLYLLKTIPLKKLLNQSRMNGLI